MQSLDITRLAEQEALDKFDCGDDDLNDFITKEAGLYCEALLAVSYVATDSDSGETLGFFSLANDRVSLGDFANKTEFNRFRKHRFPNEKRLKSYPAAKICRLGVAVSAKGQHIGTQLLDFIKSYFVVNNKTGCRFLTVDAYIEAVPFYKKNGFVQLNSVDDDLHTRLLYFDLKSID